MTAFLVSPNNIFGPITRLLDIHFPESNVTYAAPALDKTFASSASAFQIEVGVQTATWSSTQGTSNPCWVCIAIAYAITNISPANVSESSNTLTFERKARVLNPGYVAVELWAAWAPSGFNPSNASVTWSLNFPAWNGQNTPWAGAVFAVGQTQQVPEFDGSGTLPASGFDGTAALPPIVTFDTANPTDLMIAIDAAPDADTGNTGFNFPPSGWTNLTSWATAYGMHIEVNYQLTTKKQLGETYQNQSTSSGHWTTLITGMVGLPVAKKP